MSVAFHSEDMEMEETGDEIYADIVNPPSLEEQGDEIYNDVDNAPSQDKQPHMILQSVTSVSSERKCNSWLPVVAVGLLGLLLLAGITVGVHVFVKGSGTETKMEEALLAQLSTLEVRLNATVGELEQVKRHNADMAARLNASENNVEDLKKECEAHLAKLSTRLNESDNQYRQYAADLKVGFSASLAGGSHVRIGTSGSQTIVFKNVFFNNGNAYNPATGIFTAPLKGAFQFTFTTFGYSAYYSGARLLKNGQLQVSTWQAQGKHHSDSTSGAVILKLNAGDKVNLITWAWANMQVFDNLNHHTTFSGVLLFPL